MYSCARGWKTDCGGIPRELNVAYVVLGLAPLVCLIPSRVRVTKIFLRSILAHCCALEFAVRGLRPIALTSSSVQPGLAAASSLFA